MRTFAQKQKPTPKTKTGLSTNQSKVLTGQRPGVSSILQLQRTIGNQAVQRLLKADGEEPRDKSLTGVSGRIGHDFSQIPVLSGRTTREGEVDEIPGPVSNSLDAGVPLPAGVPTPAPAPPVTPPSPPAPGCTIATTTLATAPDGTANTRRTVGVNEQVQMTSSVSASWSAGGGSITPTSGTTVTWTAPPDGRSCSVTATPASGGSCSVSMRVLPPSHRSLVKISDRAYTAGLAGSGFRANVTIMPTNVSFTRTEVREEEVEASATGYYDTVHGLDKAVHPATAWLSPNASNSGLIDTIGTNPPGLGGPFSVGTFIWPIPQHHRPAGGSGSGTRYSTGTHAQAMVDVNGSEGTAKEGASRGRTP